MAYYHRCVGPVPIKTVCLRLSVQGQGEGSQGNHASGQNAIHHLDRQVGVVDKNAHRVACDHPDAADRSLDVCEREHAQLAQLVLLRLDEPWDGIGRREVGVAVSHAQAEQVAQLHLARLAHHIDDRLVVAHELVRVGVAQHGLERGGRSVAHGDEGVLLALLEGGSEHGAELRAGGGGGRGVRGLARACACACVRVRVCLRAWCYGALT